MSGHNAVQTTTRWNFNRILIGANARVGNALPIESVQISFDTLPMFARALGGIVSIPGGYKHERHAPVHTELSIGKVSLASTVRSRSTRFSAEIHDDICFTVVLTGPRRWPMLSIRFNRLCRIS